MYVFDILLVCPTKEINLIKSTNHSIPSMGLVKDRKSNLNLQMFSNDSALANIDFYLCVDNKYIDVIMFYIIMM